MPKLIVTLGPPGSAKSTMVGQWRAADPNNRARLSRDGLRDVIGIGGNRDTTNTPYQERMVTLAQESSVEAWLAWGINVAVDDTCQDQETMNTWVSVAKVTGARLVVWDFRAVPPDLCVARDKTRGAAGGRFVGEDAIREVAARCAAVAVPAGIEVVDMWAWMQHAAA